MDTGFSQLNLTSIVEPTRFAGIFGISSAQIYQDHQKGLFGTRNFDQLTYLDALRAYRLNLIKSVEVKALKEKNKHEIELKKLEEKKKQKLEVSKIDYDSGEDTLHPLVKAKMQQEIKLLKMKEISEWLKIAETRNELLSANKLESMILPFINIIKNSIVSISLDYPETREKIDEILNSLADLGQRFLEECSSDENDFISTMLEKDFDETLVLDKISSFEEIL